MLVNTVKTLIIIIVVVMFAGGTPSLAGAVGATGHAAASSASIEKVIRFLRDHYGISEEVKVTASALRDSASPEFYEATITIDDGQNQGKQTHKIYLSRDGLYLLGGSLRPLARPFNTDELSKEVRELFSPPPVKLTVGTVEESIYPGFYSLKVTADNGKSQDLYVTRDKRNLIVGEVFLIGNPEAEFARIVSLSGQMSVGPTAAPVTIVEYGDLECPYCGQMQELLENDVLPKYPGTIKVIFKEFPMAAIHTWAFAAAMAEECAYEIAPKTLLAYRRLIFTHQEDISAAADAKDDSTIRGMLLSYAEQVGIQRDKLIPCIDSKRTEALVDQSLREGKILGITRIPTLFINGKIQRNSTSSTLSKAIGEALREVKASRTRRVRTATNNSR